MAVQFGQRLAARGMSVAHSGQARVPTKNVKVAFKLTKKQRKLLAKARRVKMTATVIARDAHRASGTLLPDGSSDGPSDGESGLR